MIDDDFHLIEPDSAGNAANYDFISGSSENAEFVAGSLQDIELEAGNGTDFIAHVTEPTVIHQAVEAKFIFATSPPATAYSGVFARLTNTSNYVLLRLNHNTLQAQLVEVIAGVATVLATAPLTAAGGITGGSVRLEVIGKRARYWFEPHYRDVPDLPPDGAVDLEGDYGSTAGEWGIYFSSSASNPGMKASRFYAREMPAKCQPPPHLYIAGASGYNLSPVTATLTNVNAAAGSIEWEVNPADPDDFPEGYRDEAVAAITSRVLWLRPGYTYDVRVRELKKNGGNNDWTDWERITVPGSKVSPSSPTLPDIDFPDVDPTYVLEREQIADVTLVESDTGRTQVSAPYTQPQNSFKLVFENRLKDEIQDLITFFDETVQGPRRSFKWVHPISGQQFAMRFVADDYELVFNDQEHDSEGGAICTLMLEIVEVVEDAIGELSVAIEADLDLV